MSFFTKLKDKFTKKTDDEVTTKYEKGLEKTRNEFVSKGPCSKNQYFKQPFVEYWDR